MEQREPLARMETPDGDGYRNASVIIEEDIPADFEPTDEGTHLSSQLPDSPTTYPHRNIFNTTNYGLAPLGAQSQSRLDSQPC